MPVYCDYFEGGPYDGMEGAKYKGELQKVVIFPIKESEGEYALYKLNEFRSSPDKDHLECVHHFYGTKPKAEADKFRAEHES